MAEVDLEVDPPVLEIALVRHVDRVLELVPVLCLLDLTASLKFRVFHCKVLAIAVPVIHMDFYFAFQGFDTQISSSSYLCSVFLISVPDSTSECFTAKSFP